MRPAVAVPNGWVERGVGEGIEEKCGHFVLNVIGFLCIQFAVWNVGQVVTAEMGEEKQTYRREVPFKQRHC